MSHFSRKFITASFTALFTQCIFISNLLAVPAEFKVMKDLEKTEVNKNLPSQAAFRLNIDYKADSFRDPFQGYIIQKEENAPAAQPRVEGASTPPSLTVQGIIWGGNFPQAIINNKVVKVGDIIEEAKILEIDKSGITVFYRNKNYTFSSPAGGR